MSAAAEPVPTSNLETRNAIRQGMKLGALTGLAVIVFIYGGALLGDGLAGTGFRALVVFAAGFLIAYLPGMWVGARDADSIATAALVALVGTATFSLVDIVLLRAVLHIYPWTWDAVGGGSGWWYLPVWWMLGTFVPWMGALVIAGEAARGDAGLPKLFIGSMVGTVVLAAVGTLATPMSFGPVVVGGGLAVTTVAWATLRLIMER